MKRTNYPEVELNKLLDDRMEKTGVWWDIQPLHEKDFIQCGLQAGLWAREKRYAHIHAMALTDKGERAFTLINLQLDEGHESEDFVDSKPPLKAHVSAISQGDKPTLRRVSYTWQVRWDKAAPELKACLTEEQTIGAADAIVELYDDGWRLKDPNMNAFVGLPRNIFTDNPAGPNDAPTDTITEQTKRDAININLIHADYAAALRQIDTRCCRRQ